MQAGMGPGQKPRRVVTEMLSTRQGIALLGMLQDRYRGHTDQASALAARRRALVRDLYRAGIPVSVLAEATGLTRQRINQLLG